MYIRTCDHMSQCRVIVRGHARHETAKTPWSAFTRKRASLGSVSMLSGQEYIQAEQRKTRYWTRVCGWWESVYCWKKMKIKFSKVSLPGITLMAILSDNQCFLFFSNVYSMLDDEIPARASRLPQQEFSGAEKDGSELCFVTITMTMKSRDNVQV